MPRGTLTPRSPEPPVGRWPEHPAPGKSDPELAMPEADPPQAESSGHIPPIDKAPSGVSARFAKQSVAGQRKIFGFASYLTNPI